MTTVIVYGEMRCGKTLNANAIARHFGCDAIVDDFNPRHHALLHGALHLTNCPPKDAAHYDDEVVIVAYEKIPHSVRQRTSARDPDNAPAVPKQMPRSWRKFT